MCKQCELKPVYEFTNQRKLCKTCFIRYFQKKVLYTIRRFKMIKKDDIIAYKKTKDFRNVVLENILQMLSEKTIIQIVKLPNKKANKIAIPSTIDSEADEIIHAIIQENVKDLEKIKPIQKNIIKPLYLFLDKEVLLYAKLKKLKFKKFKTKKDKISEFIDELEEKHPEVKRAVLNSYLEINR
jgi:tRNA(Ile)-lysidine synthase TilS/MesJ